MTPEQKRQESARRVLAMFRPADARSRGSDEGDRTAEGVDAMKPVSQLFLSLALTVVGALLLAYLQAPTWMGALWGVATVPLVSVLFPEKRGKQ